MNSIKIDKPSTIFLSVFCALLALSAGIMYVRYMVLEHYDVYVDHELILSEGAYAGVPDAATLISSQSPGALLAADAMACEWDTARLYLFSENVGEPLVYYAHLFPAVAGLVLIVLMLLYGERNLLNRLLTVIGACFTIFALADLVLWASEDPSLIMFLWSSLLYFEVLVYAATAYLVYVFICKQDIPLKIKLGFGTLMVPVFLFAPTAYNLRGFDYTNCDRLVQEGPLPYYLYVVEIVFILFIVFWITRIRHIVEDRTDRVAADLVGFGALLLLLSFSWGNITGSVLNDELYETAWAIAQYGLFGMPIFLAIISYIIVQYRAFNSKLRAAQALVVAIMIPIVSLLFIQQIEYVRIVVFATILVVAAMSYMLLRSVRQEITNREKGEQLARYLANANARLRALDKQKTEFVSIASHQLRAPIAAITGYASLLADGSYGDVPDNMKEPLMRMFESGKRIAVMVDDFLNVTRMEQGRMTYAMLPVDLRKLVSDTADEMRLIADNRGLALAVVLPKDTAPLLVTGDESKLKQVFSNLIDNAIKYTKSGTVTLGVTRVQGDRSVLVEVNDTGIGIAPEEIPALFSKFTRASNANSATVSGTGLGLYIAKEIVRAHNGWIHVTSPGVGKGTTFTVELPITPNTQGEHAGTQAHK